MSHEDEVRRECERLGIQNEEPPKFCPGCGTPVEASKGYAGETVLYCPNKDCTRPVVWEDAVDAIRRVL